MWHPVCNGYRSTAKAARIAHVARRHEVRPVVVRWAEVEVIDDQRVRRDAVPPYDDRAAPVAAVRARPDGVVQHLAVHVDDAPAVGQRVIVHPAELQVSVGPEIAGPLRPAWPGLLGAGLAHLRRLEVGVQAREVRAAQSPAIRARLALLRLTVGALGLRPSGQRVTVNAPLLIVGLAQLPGQHFLTALRYRTHEFILPEGVI